MHLEERHGIKTQELQKTQTVFTEAILASQCPLFPESSFASPYCIYLFFSYRTTGQGLFYRLKKLNGHRLPPCASSLSCLYCGAQSNQISATWGRLTAAIAQGLKVGWVWGNGCVDGLRRLVARPQLLLLSRQSSHFVCHFIVLSC